MILKVSTELKHLPKKLSLICLFFFSQIALAETPPSKVTVQLLWHHQFEFAGYYAALHKGFYKDAGFDVTLIEGSSAISPIEEVVQRKADFGISSAGLVKAYVSGKPVLMLAPIFQHSPSVLITLGKNLSNPAEIAKAGIVDLQPGDESLDLKAMFINEGIPLDKVKITSEKLELQDLLDGKMVAMTSYSSNEPFYLQQRGIAYSLIKPESYGMDYYEGVLFTSQDFAKEQPEAVAAFRAATLKGWEYALENKDEIIGIILANYNTHNKSREHLAFEAKTLHQLITPELVQIGHSNPGRWRYIADTFVKIGMLKPNFDLTGFAYNPNPPPKDFTWLYISLAVSLGLVSIVTYVAFYIYRTNRKLVVSEKQNFQVHADLEKSNQTIQKTLADQQKFLDILTHELKAPLSIARFMVNSIQQHEAEKQKIERALIDVGDIIERCQQMGQLDYQKILTQSQRCHLAVVFAELTQNESAVKRLRITLHSAAEIETDAQLLKIILRNLISNAIKYSPAETTIDIDVMLAMYNQSKGVQISVANQIGKAGLPDSTQIFTKYYRSQGAKSQSGVGLGLYLVQNMTQLLGGHIRFESEQNKVIFILWLPS